MINFGNIFNSIANRNQPAIAGNDQPAPLPGPFNNDQPNNMKNHHFHFHRAQKRSECDDHDHDQQPNSTATLNPIHSKIFNSTKLIELHI